MTTLQAHPRHGSSATLPVKELPADLAVLGGRPLFAPPVSASNLAKPDVDAFLSHSRVFYDAHRYTNTGPVSRELERRLAEFHGTRYCVSFASGFWALVLAVRALAVPNRREVVMPSLTYRRMADVVAWTGLVPRYCEVDASTLAMSAETAAPCVTDETALLLGVHPIVNCCAADELEQLAIARGVPLLIDAVESCYESYRGRKVGSFGAAEVFSLHASKLINGFEGGYLTTDDEELAALLSIQRGFGFKGHDNVECFGINAKLNEVHAAMALASLEELDAQVVEHQMRYATYRTALRGLSGVRLLEFDESERCSYKNIVVELLDDWPLSRSVTLDVLHAEGVLARAYYSPALHQKMASYPTEFGPLPVTDRLAERFMLLPSGSRVSEGAVERVVSLLAFIYQHATVLDEALRPQ
ncbi:MAG: DegT/DnrJ/EryC1/StrS aminotransferase family [Acidimicrobiaceae bacterium]|nr:DegT/DnrJ/EryC1/StrS aminotransferase family [Acidimicrobiaceae bacterium]